jgi:hypothetical protein
MLLLHDITIYAMSSPNGNGIKPCISLVKDAEAVENAAMVLNDSVEKIKLGRRLSPSEMASLQLVTNVLSYASQSVKTNAKALATRGGDLEWVSKRKERDRRIEELTAEPIPKRSKKTTSLPLGTIELYNQQKGGENVRRRPKLKQKITRRKSSRASAKIPRPCNGVEFEAVEAMDILAKAPNLSPLLLHWYDKSWIPVKPRWCRYLLKKHQAGKLVSWRGPALDGSNRGRTPIASTEEFLDGCRKIQEERHRAIAREDVKDILTAIYKKHSQDNGTWAHGDVAVPSQRSIDRYFDLAADQLNVKLTNSAVQAKTNTRYTAENSLMSAMSFLLVQAVSGLIIGEPHSKTKPVETASEGARLLAELVSKANGNVPVYPVQPGMVTTTDDTTVFACVGIDNQSGKQWKLLDADESYSLRSAYVIDKDGAQNRMFSGQRIRLTKTMAGNGRMAPIFATMTGLSSDELPSEKCPSGIYFLEVPGLCVGGSDLRSEGTGTIAFVRKDAYNKDWDSAERRLFKEYNERVFYPFVRSLRQVDYNWDPTTPVPDWLKCVAWSDGGIPQLQAIVKDELQVKDASLKIDRNKHAAASSAVQQMADLCPIFRGIKQETRLVTAQNNYCSTLAEKLNDHFKKTKVLQIDSRKLKGAIDLLACLPSILSKVRSNNDANVL